MRRKVFHLLHRFLVASAKLGLVGWAAGYLWWCGHQYWTATGQYWTRANWPIVCVYWLIGLLCREVDEVPFLWQRSAASALAQYLTTWWEQL